MQSARPDVTARAPTEQRELSLRIEILRITLIAGIVILHTPPTWFLDDLPAEAQRWPGIVKLFLEFGPFRAGVPTLSLISGYLMFARPLGPYGRLIGRKMTTLVYPFLIWNGVVIGLHAAGRQNDLGVLFETTAGAEAWLRGVADLLDYPPNYPTYFLIDLFVCSALAPVLRPLLGRAPLLVLGLCGVMVAYSYGPLPTVRPDVALPFLIGAALALHRVDVRVLDACWWQLGLFFLLLCFMFIVDIARGHPSPLSLGLLRAVGIPAAWTFSAVLARNAVGGWVAGWSRYAFLVFCAHSPALHLLLTVWPGLPESYWLFYVLASPLTLIIIIAAAMLLERLAPLLANFLTGSRAGRVSMAEERPAG